MEQYYHPKMKMQVSKNLVFKVNLEPLHFVPQVTMERKKRRFSHTQKSWPCYLTPVNAGGSSGIHCSLCSKCYQQSYQCAIREFTV